MDMRALYYIYLPSERGREEDMQKHDEDVKANENCLNQNFSLLSGKVYEFEARLELLEKALERASVAINMLNAGENQSSDTQQQ